MNSMERDLTLSIEKSSAPPGTRRERLVSWLTRAAQVLSGEKFRATIPNTLSADPNLAAEILRARTMQKMGYDLSFAFLQRFPDAPFMHTCVGQYAQETWRGCGFDFFSKSHAFTTALSETIERMLWQNDAAYWKKEGLHSTFEDLRGVGLDP